MDQLVNMVCQKTGISNEQAKSAVDTVLGFLRDKLPAPIASQIDGLVGGGGGQGTPDLGQIASGLGGMFGGGDEKKDQ